MTAAPQRYLPGLSQQWLPRQGLVVTYVFTSTGSLFGSLRKLPRIFCDQRVCERQDHIQGGLARSTDICQEKYIVMAHNNTRLYI